MQNMNWSKYNELFNEVKQLESIQQRIRELEQMLADTRATEAAKISSIPPAFLQFFTNPIPELHIGNWSGMTNIVQNMIHQRFDSSVEEEEEELLSEDYEEGEVQETLPVASQKDITEFLEKLKGKLADSSVERAGRTLNAFNRACKSFYNNEPFTWLDVCDNLEAVVTWGLNENKITVNTLDGNGTYIRDFLWQFDDSAENWENLTHMIGNAKHAKKTGTIWRPLPDNAVTFEEMREKLEELVNLPNTENEVALLALLSHPDLGVFRPGEYLNCYIGSTQHQDPEQAPCNWLDMESGEYYRYNSKTCKSHLTPKRIVQIPTEVLEYLSLLERQEGESLFPADWTLETLRKTLQSLFPGKHCTPQFLRNLHVSVVAMKLPNREREQRAKDMDHSPATQAAIYAKYDA